jgi:hypothetical protein
MIDDVIQAVPEHALADDAALDLVAHDAAQVEVAQAVEVSTPRRLFLRPARPQRRDGREIFRLYIGAEDAALQQQTPAIFGVEQVDERGMERAVAVRRWLAPLLRRHRFRAVEDAVVRPGVVIEHRLDVVQVHGVFSLCQCSDE